MIDQEALRAALLAAVPSDGASIGNQALFDRLKGQFPDLTDEAFQHIREQLISEAVLAKGRGRGGAVKRVLAGEGAQMSLAEVTLSNARERLNPSELEEASATDIIETIKKPKVQASLTLCDSLLSHLISSQLHLQDAKALVKEAV